MIPECWTKPLDLGDHLSGRLPRPVPTLLKRSDGCALLYAGKVNEIHGEPESGKGWVVGQAVGEAISTGRPALYLDFDADPDAAAARILATGVTVEQIAQLVRYYPLPDPLPVSRQDGVRGWPDESADALEAMVGPEEPALVALDGVNVGMSLFDLDPIKTGDVADFLRLLAFPFRSTGTVTLLVDHVVKDAEQRGRWAYGSVHKSAALDGVSFEVKVNANAVPARDKIGRLTLVVSKDRHGEVRRISTRIGGRDIAAEVTIDGTGERTTVTIDPPTDADAFRHTVYMERVSRHVETAPEAPSGRAIVDAVSGKDEHIRQAIRELVTDGYLSTEGGPRGSTLYKVLRPFREDGSP